MDLPKIIVPSDVRRARPLLVIALALVILITRGEAPRSRAVELPQAGAFALQTNGPGSAAGLGDWYTTATGGNGYHYLTISVPCGWPSATPIYIDLFSPEMNRVAGALAKSEEPNGNYDSTQFELYGPGASVGPNPPWNLPAPGTGIAGTQVTYEPGAPGVAEHWVRYATLSPVVCGDYVLRSAVLATDPLNPTGEGNDQNGWKLRVGSDDDGDPTTAPPANTDNPDGVVGTNDEIVVGLSQVSFQQDSGASQCQTLFEYVDPNRASATFNNFDMDGNGRVRYYAPSDVLDPNGLSGGTAGTVSGATVWNNGGTLNTRAGDTILNPEPGWWRIVTCISSNNQFIQEGQSGVGLFYNQPSTPQLAVTKDDGQTQVSEGQSLTYTIDIANTASRASAGAANTVVVTDTLPGNTTFQGCAIILPATGTCSASAGAVTASLAGWINAGNAAQVTVTATVNSGATGTVDNSVSVAYVDGLGNPFPPVVASDSDTIAPTPTPTDTSTPTSTATATPSPSVTPTPAATATPTSSVTATDTATATPTATNTPTATSTAIDTATATPSATPTATPSPTATDTPTATPTPTTVASATPTPTGTVAATSTSTPAASSNSTPTSTQTFVSTQTATDTPTATPSSVGAPADTPSPAPVPTNTAVPTATLAADPFVPQDGFPPASGADTITTPTGLEGGGTSNLGSGPPGLPAAGTGGLSATPASWRRGPLVIIALAVIIGLRMAWDMRRTR